MCVGRMVFGSVRRKARWWEGGTCNPLVLSIKGSGGKGGPAGLSLSLSSQHLLYCIQIPLSVVYNGT